MTMRRSWAAVAIFWVAGAGGVCRGDTLTFPAVMDSTLFAESGTASNGGGDFVFVGRNDAGLVRRGLVRFDLSAIPAGSTISAAVMTLHASEATPGAQPVSVHRVAQSWGEGVSDAKDGDSSGARATENDATWVYRLYDVLQWSTPGGSVAESASDAIEVDAADRAYAWSGSGVAADVALWVNNAGQNFGWALIGPENVRSAKRFNSRTHPVKETRPTLTVTFSPSTPIGGCCSASGGCSVLSRAECEALSGTYRGDSVYCDEGGCEATSTAIGSGESEAEPDAGGAAPVVDRDEDAPDDGETGLGGAAGGVLTAPVETR